MILISPSKNLSVEREDYKLQLSSPIFKKKARLVTKYLKSLKPNQVKEMMNISDKLVDINIKRFADFDSINNVKKPAIFLFTGGTYSGLSAKSYDSQTLHYAQKKLRILSGLYGVLRPLDEIQPYRLEMGTDTKNLIGKNLYDFWETELTNFLNNEINSSNSKILFNLASKEYFSVINKNKINIPIINFDFKTRSGSIYKNIGMQIKKMRGSMAKYIIQNKIESLEELKNFSFNNFKFEKLISDTNTFLFSSS